MLYKYRYYVKETKRNYVPVLFAPPKIREWQTLLLAPLAESQSSLCHGEMSVVRALTFSFKRLLLPNHLANLVETS